MRATETRFRADALAVLKEDVEGLEYQEGRVSLWEDSVGEAAKQLGIVVTLAIVTELASGLLSCLANAWH